MLRYISIRSRLILMMMLLVAALVATNLVLLNRTHALRQLVEQQVQNVEMIAAAGAALHTFGNLKYWVTDSAVSHLILSKKKAENEREDLDAQITALTNAMPGSLTGLSDQLDHLLHDSFEAEQAYKEGNHLVGNAMMAKGRAHILAIDAKLGLLVSHLRSEAEVSANDAITETSQGITIALVTVFLMIVGVAIMTVLIMHSIVSPLRQMVSVINAMRAGKMAASIPISGRDEITAMAQVLNLFRESVARREEAEQTEAHLREALESIPVGFGLFGADDRLIMTNQIFREHMWRRDLGETGTTVLVPGVKFEELAKFVANEAYAKGEVDDPQDWIDARMERHRNPSGPLIQQHRDGEWVQINEHKTSNGGTVVFYVDITELKVTEEALRLAKETAEAATLAKSQFLANMSHELRTPLNAIIGFTRLMKRKAADVLPRQQYENLDRILISGTHLLALINNVLDLSKIEAGQMDLESEVVELAPILEDCIRTIEPMAEEKSVQIRWHADREDCRLTTDPGKLRQILINLLSNAIKFTEEGEITVICSHGEEGLMIAVKDTGVGIPEAELAHIFEEFHQVDASSTRKHGGTGLGLSISLQLARLLGGELSAQSTYGEGSSFTLALPVSSQ